MTTGAELHDALLRAINATTRTRHPGHGKPVTVNAIGVDVWENHVGNVALDSDGTAHAYLFLQTGPGGHRYTRMAPHSSGITWRPILTFAGGTPEKVHWAMGMILPLLDRRVLTSESGVALSAPMHQGSSPRESYDPGPLRLDQDPSPPRWYVPIHYATTAQ